MRTEERIKKVAIELFAKYGFVRASIRDIVKEVGVTSATFYIHFKTKHDLLYQIIEGIGTTLIEEMERVVQNQPDPVKCLKEMIVTHVCLVKKRWKEVKIYMEELYQLTPKLEKRALQQHRRIYDIYKQKILEVEEVAGWVSPLNESVATFAIFSMMNWTYQWFKNNGSLSIEEIANQIVRIYFNGIACQQGVNKEVIE